MSYLTNPIPQVPQIQLTTFLASKYTQVREEFSQQKIMYKNPSVTLMEETWIFPLMSGAGHPFPPLVEAPANAI